MEFTTVVNHLYAISAGRLESIAVQNPEPRRGRGPAFGLNSDLALGYRCPDPIRLAHFFPTLYPPERAEHRGRVFQGLARNQVDVAAIFRHNAQINVVGDDAVFFTQRIERRQFLPEGSQILK